MVGSPDTWSAEMRVAFGIIHSSDVAAALWVHSKMMYMCWNDQYARTIVRAKHPQMYGRNGCDVFGEVPGLDIMVGDVFRTKKSFTVKAFACVLDRNDSPGFREEAFFDFTLGPLLNAQGECWAVLNFAVDVTQQNLLFVSLPRRVP
jgi:hypothetical protein